MKWVNLFCIIASRYITPFHATGLILYPPPPQKKMPIFSGGMKRDFLSKCDRIRRKLRVLSHLLKKFLRENINFFQSPF